jgi:hypothetical protein
MQKFAVSSILAVLLGPCILLTERLCPVLNLGIETSVLTVESA